MGRSQKKKKQNQKAIDLTSWQHNPENDKPVWIGLGVVMTFLLVLLAIGTTMRPM